MADDVAITAGAGTNIATDDCTSGHVQLVKIAYSADGVRTHATVDADGVLVNLGANNDVTVTSGTVTANLAAGTNNIGDVDVLTLPTLPAGTNYVGKVRLTDGTNDASVTSAGSLYVGGSTAHDIADAGNPIKNGFRARSTNITAIASDDRSDQIGTLHGFAGVQPYAIPQASLTGTASSTGTGDTAVIAAQGAGVTINVTSLMIYNDSATNTYVNIKDGTTTRLVVAAPAKGGGNISLPFPLRITANTALNFASASAVTTMYVSAVGFAGI